MGSKTNSTPSHDPDLSEVKDFNKLCKDVLKLGRVYSNPRYAILIGFDMQIKIYFTPKQKNKIEQVISKIDQEIISRAKTKVIKLKNDEEESAVEDPNFKEL